MSKMLGKRGDTALLFCPCEQGFMAVGHPRQSHNDPPAQNPAIELEYGADNVGPLPPLDTQTRQVLACSSKPHSGDSEEHVQPRAGARRGVLAPSCSAKTRPAARRAPRTLLALQGEMHQQIACAPDAAHRPKKPQRALKRVEKV